MQKVQNFSKQNNQIPTGKQKIKIQFLSEICRPNAKQTKIHGSDQNRIPKKQQKVHNYR